jgi:adenosylcobyric acid synthase
VIEGAGSPAEINLKDRDIVNMHVARVAEAPVLLAGDIDRGGVFAALVGTLELLEPDERARIAAFVINKFRGDRALLAPGLDMLTARTGKPVLGVLPYLPRLRIADEDSVSLEHRVRRARGHADDIDIVVVRLPRISNHDDVEPLEHEPGVTVRFAERVEELAGADLVILPGSKNTASDLTWLRATELADAIGARARAGQPVLGICGGCQMLGERIEDPLAIESPQPVTAGLGLLPLRTRFAPEKITARVSARVLSGSFVAPAGLSDLAGYEIHMGMLATTEPGPAPFQVQRRSGRTVDVRDGAIGCEGAVVGTMLHGLFENDALRRHMLDALRARRGLPAPSGAGAIAGKQSEYDRLEAALRDNVDRGLLLRIVDLA